MKLYLTLKEKKVIVDEAYSQDKNIRPTALKYSVQPNQIRRWKKTLDSILRQEDLSDSRLQHILELKSTQTGRPKKDQDEVYSKLKEFYDERRSNDRIVTVNMLYYEMKRLTGTESPKTAIVQRIYRFMAREQIVKRRITHVAQNTRHETDIIDGFVNYVNGQIVCGKFLKKMS